MPAIGAGILAQVKEKDRSMDWLRALLGGDRRNKQRASARAAWLQIRKEPGARIGSGPCLAEIDETSNALRLGRLDCR